jgi:hypothetical protein
MTMDERKADERGQQDAPGSVCDAEHSAADASTLLALASEINQQLAWPYALSLLIALSIGLGAAGLAVGAAGPWVATPLAGVAGCLFGLALTRLGLLRPWVRSILRRGSERSIASQTTLDAVAALAEDDRSLSLLASAHRRWERS